MVPAPIEESDPEPAHKLPDGVFERDTQVEAVPGCVRSLCRSGGHRFDVDLAGSAMAELDPLAGPVLEGRRMGRFIAIDDDHSGARHESETVRSRKKLDA